jgi:glucosyl-3-phosphoglycerate synthase
VRAFHHADFPIERLVRERRASVSVCLPARECAATVGRIVTTLGALRERGVLDEVVVVDAASADGTAELARDAGATVFQQDELRPELGPVEGKGDAMWRALGELRGDVVAFLDADTEDFGAHFATGLLGPLLLDDGVDFVKAFYRRPLGDDPVGGGRVNHLMARPALRVLFPELATVRQPLAGEVAARRSLLERIPFATGYGIEAAMLVDVWHSVGLDRMAQVDLDVMHNPHQPLHALTPMAETVLRVLASRRGVPGVDPIHERPPLVPA